MQYLIVKGIVTTDYYELVPGLSTSNIKIGSDKLL